MSTGLVTLAFVGDIMLDRFLWGGVSRISPEAPVPVVRVEEEASAVGGAGNVAANVAALGAASRSWGAPGGTRPERSSATRWPPWAASQSRRIC